MQVERDALHRTVMPRLREQAAKNGENIQFVDLRWGIFTADLDNKESTSKILSICLQEVQNCKPYMIVLLGDLRLLSCILSNLHKQKAKET